MGGAGVGCGVPTFISALPPNILQLRVDGRAGGEKQTQSGCGCLLSAVVCGVVAVAQVKKQRGDRPSLYFGVAHIVEIPTDPPGQEAIGTSSNQC